MKDLKVERIVYNGYDKEKEFYKYSVFCDDFIYKFLVKEIKKDNSSFFRSHKNEYKILLDFSFISKDNLLVTSLCSSEPILALCDYLNYHYENFKNDVYAKIDKKYFFDYVKEGVDNDCIFLPIENLYTPNSHYSESDTICALIDKEHSLLDDDSDFIIGVIDKILEKDKIYIQPFLSELTQHLFYEFLTDEEKKEKPKNRPKYHIPIKDNFERKLESYDDIIEFKRTFEDFEDENYSIEKLEFTIKHNFLDRGIK